MQNLGYDCRCDPSRQRGRPVESHNYVESPLRPPSLSPEDATCIESLDNYRSQSRWALVLLGAGRGLRRALAGGALFGSFGALQERQKDIIYYFTNHAFGNGRMRDQ